MLKGYRKRFVLYNMLLVGVALLLALVVLGFFLYRSNYRGLRSTMQMVVTPWGKMGDRMRADPLEQRKDAPPEKPEGTPEKPGGEKNRLDDMNVVTAFYFPDTDKVALIASDEEADSEALTAAVREAIAQEKFFGKLPSGAWIYYKEPGPRDCKVALTDGNYLRDKLLGICAMLFLIYLGAMALVFCISLWLSKLAAKPMEDAMRMERQFTADVSHDLKTPITVVLANSSILKSNPDADAKERMQWIDSTETAAKKMMTMVEQMLTLSSLEAKGRKLEKAPVNLSSTAERVALELDSLAFERGVTVETELAEDVRVFATEEYADRICSSLLENAIKYEPDGGRVEMKLTADRKKATLTVQNHGGVISPEDLPHVFERFYRGDKARTAQSGHGLGLPILKQIVDLLGGEIRVESSEETGTVFTVVLDRADASA